jgi:hypothetical protein
MNQYEAWILLQFHMYLTLNTNLQDNDIHIHLHIHDELQTILVDVRYVHHENILDMLPYILVWVMRIERIE